LSRSSILPWGKGKAIADRAFARSEMRSGKPFSIDVAAQAPPDWNHRIILTPILEHMGAGACARIVITEAKKK